MDVVRLTAFAVTLAVTLAVTCVGLAVAVCFLIVTGLFLSNENTIGPAVDLVALVLREAARDR